MGDPIFITAKRFVPTFLKDKIKIVVMDFRDLVDRIKGKRGKHVPPSKLLIDGSTSIVDYLEGGKRFVKTTMSLLSIKSSCNILDIGSGVGRHTLPLVNYLDSASSYEGIEVIEDAVKWCNNHITNRYPNFKFQHLDIYNGAYNPRGKILPEEFVFPFEDNSFDIVMALSVFTHMTPDSVQNYLKESYRVLKPGGKAYFTYFLINDDSKKRLGDQNNTQPFEQTPDGYWTTNHQIPEAAIAYDEDVIRRFYSDSNLKINKIYYGSWCGRKKFTDYQDIVLASKK